jgi:glutamyl-tRNA synthetase
VDEGNLEKIATLIQVRLVTLDEAPTWAGFFFEDEVYPEPKDLIAKNMSAPESLETAKRAYEVLRSLEDFSRDTTEPLMRALAEELGLKPGQVFGILRIAITGQKVSPPLFESMEIIGRKVVLSRIEEGISVLEELVASEGD